MFSELQKADGWSVSDFYYVPTCNATFYQQLMELFHEHRVSLLLISTVQVFHEIALNKYLHTVPFERFAAEQKRIFSMRTEGREVWLYGGNSRSQWPTKYTEHIVTLHPIKQSGFTDLAKRYKNTWNQIFRKVYCHSVVRKFFDHFMGGKRDFLPEALKKMPKEARENYEKLVKAFNTRSVLPT